MGFTFQLSEYNQENMEAQVSKALEKRTELSSRRKFPWMWKAIDRLDGLKVLSCVSRRRAIRYKIYGVVLLTLGIFLLVPGLMVPKELLVPLITGAICILLGLLYLLPRRKKPSQKFHAAAVKLLAGVRTAEQLGNAPILVCFAQDGMMLPNGEVVPYDCFDAIAETESIYLLTWKERVTVLQKRDLIAGTHEDFLWFLEEKTDLKPDYVR